MENYEFGGEAYEYNVLLYGGPMDGLNDTIVSDLPNPPKFYAEIVGPRMTEPKKLGKKLLDHIIKPVIPGDTRVAVYKIEGSPSEYKDDDKVVPYYYVESCTMDTFRQNYPES